MLDICLGDSRQDSLETQVLKARAESGSSSKRGSKKLLKLEKALIAKTAANSASAAS